MEKRNEVTDKTPEKQKEAAPAPEKTAGCSTKCGCNKPQTIADTDALSENHK